MANEIGIIGSQYGGSGPLYAVAYILPTDGSSSPLASRSYVNAANGSASTYNAANWASYAFPLTLANDGNWYGTFPQAATGGKYWVEVYQRSASTPATTDTDIVGGEFDWIVSPTGVDYTSTPTALDWLALDALSMMDLAEPFTYNIKDGNGNTTASYTLAGVVNREVPSVITEDGKVVSGDVQIAFPNQTPITAINKDQDTVNVAARYGGPTREMVIVSMFNSDGGMWTIKVRG